MNVHTFTVKNGQHGDVAAHPIQDPTKTLVIMFGASGLYDSPELIHRVCETYPGTTVMGCSTSGEIFDTQISDNSVTVGVIEFSQATLKFAAAPVQNASDSYHAGEVIGHTINQSDLRGVFVLSDGLKMNGSELVRGLNASLPESVVVTGGLAGDGDRFQRTWVLKDGQPQEGYVTAVGFCGDSIEIGHGTKGGWDIFGPERRVTRSEGNVLYELDGKPALQLYKEYLGDRASELPASALFFPLALRTKDSDANQVVRTILGVDEANQSMTFAGDIPMNSMAQLMRANFDRLVAGASQAATLTGVEKGGDQTTLAIAISCVGRRLVLGERTEEEIEATLDVLPKQTKQIGFYSYGELSPYTNGRCDLHNQTMTLTTISES